jgi:SAM-dependent methyltransferase
MKNSIISICERTCPICGTSECEVLHKQQFVLPEGHPQAAGYNIVCCEGCGFVFADTTVSQQDYDNFYSKNSIYQDKATSTGGGDKPWDAERLKSTAAKIAEYLPDKNSSIIDIGCANGGLLKSLRDLGFNYLQGIDPSPVCVANTKMQGIAATRGTLSSIMSMQMGQFDCVLLSHVLEHVGDLRGAISAIANYLKPEGFVYIEVPDASRYHEFVTSPFQDFNTEHINHFSSQSLSNLFSFNRWSIKGNGRTEISSSENTQYPVVYGVFNRKGVINSFDKDNSLRDQINLYINKSSAIMVDIDQKIKSVLAGTEKVIVWGTGQLVMKLLSETSLGNAKIEAFVDSNPINQGNILHGVCILSPSQIESIQLPIIVASILHGQEIERMIKFKYQMPNKIILL